MSFEVIDGVHVDIQPSVDKWLCRTSHFPEEVIPDFYLFDGDLPLEEVQNRMRRVVRAALDYHLAARKLKDEVRREIKNATNGASQADS